MTAPLTPREIVAELDKYIIGQQEAKRSVAIALRNRWRRQQVPQPLRDEIAPKNIIMIGPTGVGKTEIARRLATLANSPFIKVEASKFTEVGYVGRDVESMVRDLVELAVGMVREEERQAVAVKARENAEERMLDLLVPPGPAAAARFAAASQPPPLPGGETRERFRTMLREGRLDEREVEMEVDQAQAMPMVEMLANQGMGDLGSGLRDAFSKIFPQRKTRQRMKVSEAMAVLVQEESAKLIDMERVTKQAIGRTEQSGIIFLDEIDKIASREGHHSGEVSREGVQRDLLPIVEGSTVTTKYGMVRTDHILFIASGAFHLCKPSDLVPELQGRFPIRVELGALGEEEFHRILTEPQNALTKQYVALLATEEVNLVFADDGIRQMARIAAEVNQKTENIGARRLHTIMEKVLEELSFDAGRWRGREFVVDSAHVRERLAAISGNEDLSRFIL